MKTIITTTSIATIIIGVIILSFYSCTKQELFGTNNQSLAIPEECKVIGEKHNEGLDFAFSAIRSHYTEIASKSSTAEIIVMSKNAVLDLGRQAVVDFCAKALPNVSNDFYTKITEQSIETKSNNLSISPQIAKYIDRIKILLENEPEKPEDLIAELNKINADAALNLSEQDAIAVYAGTSTCYNSYVYWKKNFMKWIIALRYPQLLTQYSDDELNSLQIIDGKLVANNVVSKGWWDDAWGTIGETWDSAGNSISNWWNYGGGKEVVASDAGGAAYGALNGAIIGAAFGGVGAAPGSVAGAIDKGLEASIASCIATWIVK